MASGIVIALTLIFLGHHITHYGTQAQSLAVRAWKFFERTSHSCTDDAVREEHVKAALWDLRAKIYRHCIEFLVHVVGFAIIGMGYKLSVDPLSMFQLVQLCLMGCVYTAHHSVLSGRLQLNWTNLRGIYCVFYASFIIFVLVNLWQNETAARAVINQAFNVCSRMIMSVIFIDTLTAAPAQIAISMAEVFEYSMKEEVADTIVYAWVQVLISAGIIGFSAVLEYWVTSHISALVDTESMLSSFRHMLRGVCDGEVLLTEEMKIKEDAECLKHLLMNSASFKGKDFEKFLDPEEVARFRDFLQQSNRDALQPEERRPNTPPCLRISLRGASDIRVGVDLWHVPMRGKDGSMHLIALREDSEAAQRVVLAVEGQKDIAIPFSKESDSETTSETHSESQKSSLSFLQSFPELSDMTLCVDTSTHWFDVEQAHLSFVRQPQSSDFSMPSLRRLVRPTDWETVRSKLKAVAARNGEEIMRLRLQDDAKRSLIANTVQISAYRPPRGGAGEMKLCLNFSDLVFEGKHCEDGLD
ncbi:unnamed protein product [Durusdinium trenchii]|uniref:Uncharacterized protein n=2 Tax=Durusdinium trenchii TaxID=1381693 RepID=A0ABP0KN95_9DINO